jgi:hypothetical protein
MSAEPCDAIIAQEVGKRRLARIPVSKPGQTMQPAGALRLQPTLCCQRQQSAASANESFFLGSRRLKRPSRFSVCAV